MLGLIIPLVMFAEAALAPGTPLPPLQGEYLSNKKASLPDDAKGKFAVLAVGFTYASRAQVEPWGKRVLQYYKNDPKVKMCEIAMIGGLSRLGKPFIDSGMRKGTPKEQYENVITVYKGTDAWKDRLAAKDDNAAHVVLIDPQGRLQWIYHGPPTTEAFQELASRISALEKGEGN